MLFFYSFDIHRFRFSFFRAEAESPATFKDHNLSDIQPLDETADTSFRLRVSVAWENKLSLVIQSYNKFKANLCEVI